MEAKSWFPLPRVPRCTACRPSCVLLLTLSLSLALPIPLPGPCPRGVWRFYPPGASPPSPSGGEERRSCRPSPPLPPGPTPCCVGQLIGPSGRAPAAPSERLFALARDRVFWTVLGLISCDVLPCVMPTDGLCASCGSADGVRHWRGGRGPLRVSCVAVWAALVGSCVAAGGESGVWTCESPLFMAAQSCDFLQYESI